LDFIVGCCLAHAVEEEKMLKTGSMGKSSTIGHFLVFIAVMVKFNM
jgi:hypothetical protein